MDISRSLHELCQSAKTLWQDYLTKGPGKLSADALLPFERDRQRLVIAISSTHGAEGHTEPPWDELLRTISDLEEILRRCVERTEGLCFVTGEAGLLPRKDLHESSEQHLQTLAAFVEQLGG